MAPAQQDARAWFFRDRSGSAQGPFSGEQMRDWLHKGFLSAHVALAHAPEGPYSKLAAFYPDCAAAFEGPPQAPRAEDEVSLDAGDDQAWYFKDEHGAIQGPFSGPQMNEWSRMGYFDASLPVRSGASPEAPFVAMQALFEDLPSAFLPAGVVIGSPRASAEPGLAQSPSASPRTLQSAASSPSSMTHALGGSLHRHSSSLGAQPSGAELAPAQDPAPPARSTVFSRVSKHRRSNSAGSSLGPSGRFLGAAASAASAEFSLLTAIGGEEIPPRLSPTAGAPALSSGSSNRSVRSAGSGATSGANRDSPVAAAAASSGPGADGLSRSGGKRSAGKKLLAVVATPKNIHAGVRFHRRRPSEGWAAVSEAVRRKREDGPSAAAAAAAAATGTAPAAATGGNHGRLASLGKYGQRKLSLLTSKRSSGSSKRGASGAVDDWAALEISGAPPSLVSPRTSPSPRARPEWPSRESSAPGQYGRPPEPLARAESDRARSPGDERDAASESSSAGSVPDLLDRDDDDVDGGDSGEGPNGDAAAAGYGDGDGDGASEGSRRNALHRAAFRSADSDSDSERDEDDAANDDDDNDDDGGAGRGLRSFRFASRQSDLAAMARAPLTAGDAVTQHVHALLAPYRGGGFAAAAPEGDTERRLAQLQLQVAELQDENSQLKAYVRRVHATVTEASPELLPRLPPEPVMARARPRQPAASQPTASQPTASQPAASQPAVGQAAVAQPPAAGRHVRRDTGASGGDEDAALWEDFVVVEFDEDSPMLRRKLSAFAEGVDQLRAEFKDVVKTSYGYLDACAEELEGLLAFADDLNQPETRKLSPLMQLFHEMLKFMAQLRAHMLESLQANLISSFESFLKNDMKQAQTLRGELQRARDAYESLEARYVHHRRTKGGVRVGGVGVGAALSGSIGRTHDAVEGHMFTELQAARARFELARFGLVQQINQLESKKRFILVERTARCIEDMLEFFRQGYVVMAAHAGTVEAARAEISGVQSKFDVVVEKWNEKRIQLESQLHSGAFPFRSAERIREHQSRARDKVTVQSSASRASHDPLCLHEGYLYKRSSSVRKDWKRRWFVLRSDQLLYYRGWKDPTPQPVCDILLCTVREVKAPELKCCFEIISPKRRAYMLQAVSEADMHTWMAAIRKAVEVSLVKQQQRPSLSRSSGLADPEVALLLSQNCACADCGAEGPDWVSINLGVVMCIACSGIHRSLGSHVSKVRSATLDRLPRSLLQMLRRLGNDAVNAHLEAALPQAEKLAPAADRDARLAFVRAKYVERRWARPATPPPVDAVLALCAADDVEGLLRALLDGFAVNSAGAAPEDAAQECTALHIAAAAGSVEAVELLCQNGADIGARNSEGETPLEMALSMGQEDTALVLQRIAGAQGLPRSPPLSPASVDGSVAAALKRQVT